MRRKKEFGDGIIFTITNHLCWLLMVNIYFWILNIPIIFIVSTMAISGDYSINLLLILALLPVGPALTALYSVMGKLIREGDINVTKDFFEAYKENFLEALFFGGMGVVIIFILLIDIKFFSNNTRLYYLEIILRAIIFICLALSMYIFPILSRFYLKRKDVLKLSLIYLCKKIHICIISVATIFMLFKIIGTIIILFLVGIIGYLVMYLEKGMLKEIEANLKINDNLEEKKLVYEK